MSDELVRFWSKVDVRSADECWPWIGARSHGYGRIWISPRNEGAHAFSWILANGEDIPAGLVVKHACDNPPCVNPAHLSVGTHSENTREAIERGLFTPPIRQPGETCRQGHPQTPENTYHYGNHRRCKPCMRERERKYFPRRNERRRRQRMEKRMKKASS